MATRYDVCQFFYNPVEPMLKISSAMGNPGSEMIGVITATVFIGGFFGAMFVAYPADRFGRRPVIIVGSLLCIAGSAVQAAASTRNIFIGGRLIIGFGISFTTCAGPSLLNELGHPRLRGKMASMVRRSYPFFFLLEEDMRTWMDNTTNMKLLSV